MKYISLLFCMCMLFASCDITEEREVEEAPAMSYAYDEQYRPQFHFSPPENWMNDPNGMVYHDGEYHLFYQYYPDSTVWGPMHWGHAVSKDLIFWQHLPVALFPDSLGYIFSGSAVVDEQNTSGFGSKGNPPMVAIFTHHSPTVEKNGQRHYQYQSLAYSLDNGRTWKKHEGNPVLINEDDERDFRDPKVFWYPENQEWIMALAVEDHVELYHSPDLKDWSYLSEFGQGVGAQEGVWECPDLFPLTTPHGETKWVMLVSINPGGLHGGSGTQYFVGDFDGATFTSDFDSTEIHWLDHGADNYAGVTWSGMPAHDRHKLFIGWMSNWEYGQLVPTKKWRSAMTVPRKLSLRDEGRNEWVVKSEPIQELKRLRENSTKIIKQLVSGMAGFSQYVDKGIFRVKLDMIKVKDSHDFVITFSNKHAEKINIGYNPGKHIFYFDRLSAGLDDFSSKFGIVHEVPFYPETDTIRVDILVDHSSIEVFLNEGELVMTELVFPSTPYLNFTIDTKTQPLLLNGEISELKSIWK